MGRSLKAKARRARLVLGREGEGGGEGESVQRSGVASMRACVAGKGSAPGNDRRGRWLLTSWMEGYG